MAHGVFNADYLYVFRIMEPCVVSCCEVNQVECWITKLFAEVHEAAAPETLAAPMVATRVGKAVQVDPPPLEQFLHPDARCLFIPVTRSGIQPAWYAHMRQAGCARSALKLW